MLFHLFKVTWRNLRRDQLTAAIKIGGLGLGLTVGVMVVLYLQHEWSYDRWLPQHENTYRVYRLWEGGGHLITPGPVAAALREEVAGVASTARALPWSDMLLSWRKTYFTIDEAYSTDSTFFQTVRWPFALGDPATAFRQPNSVVLSAELARRIFGEQNPLGETLLLENVQPLQVTGVLAPAPDPTHLTAELYLFEDLGTTSWTGARGYTYVRLQDGVRPENVETALAGIAERETAREQQSPVAANNLANWKLQPIASAHLHSTDLGETGDAGGSPWQLTIMALLGAIIIGLAIVNYINLTTARLRQRAPEIGIRRISGAGRAALFRQFLTESLVLVGLALAVALLLAGIFLPFFNEIVSRPLRLSDLTRHAAPIWLLVLTVGVGLLAGSLPAYQLSGLPAVKSLKRLVKFGRRQQYFRNSLVVGQFALTIGLLLFVSLVWRQVQFMLQKELGFAGDQIAVFRIKQEETAEAFTTYKARLEALPGVLSVTQTAQTLGGLVSNYKYRLPGLTEAPYVNTLFVDHDWNEAFQLPLVAGRFFSAEHATDTLHAFVVNEAFVKAYKLDQPIGQRMQFFRDSLQGTIIGVVQDFHYQNLQTAIEPLAISARPDMAGMDQVAVRLAADQLATALPAVTAFWQAMEPAFPVTYTFLDEAFARQYAAHERFGRSLLYATVLCLLIALSGLFGLTVFVVQQRTKEIGIRKVLGASVAGIVRLLSADFLQLVVIAFAIAAPVAWYLMQSWLTNFAYQTPIAWWLFAAVGLLAVGVSFLTVGAQSMRAALANPVKALRSE